MEKEGKLNLLFVLIASILILIICTFFITFLITEAIYYPNGKNIMVLVGAILSGIGLLSLFLFFAILFSLITKSIFLIKKTLYQTKGLYKNLHSLLSIFLDFYVKKGLVKTL